MKYKENNRTKDKADVTRQNQYSLKVNSANKREPYETQLKHPPYK